MSEPLDVHFVVMKSLSVEGVYSSELEALKRCFYINGDDIIVWMGADNWDYTTWNKNQEGAF